MCGRDIALSQLVAKLPGKQPIGPTAGASLQAHCRLQSAASASAAGADGRELSDSASPSPVLADFETRRTAPLAADTHFVDVLQEVGRIFIDAIRAGTLEFVLAVAAGQETNAKGAGTLRS